MITMKEQIRLDSSSRKLIYSVKAATSVKWRISKGTIPFQIKLVRGHAESKLYA